MCSTLQLPLHKYKYNLSAHSNSNESMPRATGPAAMLRCATCYRIPCAKGVQSPAHEDYRRDSFGLGVGCGNGRESLSLRPMKPCIAPLHLYEPEYQSWALFIDPPTRYRFSVPTLSLDLVLTLEKNSGEKRSSLRPFQPYNPVHTRACISQSLVHVRGSDLA